MYFCFCRSHHRPWWPLPWITLKRSLRSPRPPKECKQVSQQLSPKTGLSFQTPDAHLRYLSHPGWPPNHQHTATTHQRSSAGERPPKRHDLTDISSIRHGADMMHLEECGPCRMWSKTKCVVFGWLSANHLLPQVRSLLWSWSGQCGWPQEWSVLVTPGA